MKLLLSSWLFVDLQALTRRGGRRSPRLTTKSSNFQINLPPLGKLSNQMTAKCYRTSKWVHTVRVEASLSSIWRRMVYLWRLWYCGGEVEENLEVLVLLVLVWECNGLQTQTQQPTHAFPFFITYLGRIEQESAPLYPISRTIVPNLAPGPTLENSLQTHKVPTKWSACWHPTRRRTTSIAPVVSW